LLAPETSACLLEVDFLSSPDGERRLTDGGALDAIAATLARALRDHVSMRPMPAPLPMPSPMPMSASESLPAPAPAAWRAGEGTASAPPTLAGPSSPAVVRVQVAEDRPPARATNGTWHALGRHELYEND
jgi:hypothetical protein